MKVLITGDGGFVGQHLTPKIKDWVGYDLKRGQDIRNIQQLDLFFEQAQPEIVIHMAALAGVRQGETYPAEYYSTNVLGTQNVVNMCVKYGVRHLINFSSSSVFGMGKPPVKEDDSKNPLGVYGISKLVGEFICQSAIKIPQVTTIRPFTVYGLNGRPEQVVYKWINQIKTKKEITKYGGEGSNRGYVFVNDLIDGVLAILGKTGKWKYEDFNLGGHEVITIDDLVKMFQDLSPIPFTVKSFILPSVDPLSNFANIRKASKILGFNPPIKFRDNLKIIIEKEFKVD